MNKFIFTSFCLGVFITSLLLGWINALTAILIGTVTTILLVFLAKTFFSKYDSPNISKNSFLFAFFSMFFISFILSLFSGFAPLLVEQPRPGEYRPGDDAQKRRNSYRNLGAKTDRELAAESGETKNWIPFSSWITRWICTATLLLLTVLFGFITFTSNLKNISQRL